MKWLALSLVVALPFACSYEGDQLIDKIASMEGHIASWDQNIVELRNTLSALSESGVVETDDRIAIESRISFIEGQKETAVRELEEMKEAAAAGSQYHFDWNEAMRLILNTATSLILGVPIAAKVVNVQRDGKRIQRGEPVQPAK